LKTASENPKSEYRNPKQIQIFKSSKTTNQGKVLELNAVQFAHPGASYQAVVIPAEAGIQAFFNCILDSRLRGNDELAPF
jgi:hypothetical protein